MRIRNLIMRFLVVFTIYTVFFFLLAKILYENATENPIKKQVHGATVPTDSTHQWSYVLRRCYGGVEEAYRGCPD